MINTLHPTPALGTSITAEKSCSFMLAYVRFVSYAKVSYALIDLLVNVLFVIARNVVGAPIARWFASFRLNVHPNSSFPASFIEGNHSCALPDEPESPCVAPQHMILMYMSERKMDRPLTGSSLTDDRNTLP